MLAYIIGGSAYFYIAYVGSFGTFRITKEFWIDLSLKIFRLFKVTSMQEIGK